MTRYVLGLDGGGTKTRAVIVDDRGRLCGTGVGGPSNFDDVGIGPAQASIGQAVDAARQMAALPQRPFAAVFLGMAGVLSSSDRAIVQEMAQNLELASPEAVGIDHDCRVALAGGLSGRPGIVQIAGTGSSTFGMNEAGETWRAGGWGYLISDEGSSYWLGTQAMRLAVSAFDGRLGPTTLLERVQQQLQLADMNEIMHRIYIRGLSRAEVAGLAPLAIEAARAGDKVALALLDQGSLSLAEAVLAVAQRLGFSPGRCELAMVGGLFQAGDIFVQRFKAAVLDKLPACRVIPAELPPVLGAGLLALQLLNVPLNDGVRQSLRQAAEQL
jgi:N-acetylglucosamine kinase